MKRRSTRTAENRRVCAICLRDKVSESGFEARKDYTRVEGTKIPDAGMSSGVRFDVLAVAWVLWGGVWLSYEMRRGGLMVRR